MEELADRVASLLRQTRTMLLPHWGNIESDRNKGRGAIDHVTRLDVEIEEFLKLELERLDPGIAFAGEELGGGRDAERFWLCDPIDGTGHFIRGLPFCTVMLALIENQQVVLSFIYDFVNDDLYHARRGGGAFKNDEPIRVSEREISDAYIAWETHLDKEENLEKFLWLRSQASLFKTLSSGYEFALIATGKLDGRVVFDGYGKDWDFAAGSLLVEEAGGAVANIGKRTYVYSDLDFIIGNKKVVDSLTTASGTPFTIS